MGLKKLQVITKPQILKRLSAAHKAQREVADKIISKVEIIRAFLQEVDFELGYEVVIGVYMSACMCACACVCV